MWRQYHYYFSLSSLGFVYIRFLSAASNAFGFLRCGYIVLVLRQSWWFHACRNCLYKRMKEKNEKSTATSDTLDAHDADEDARPPAALPGLAEIWGLFFKLENISDACTVPDAVNFLHETEKGIISDERGIRGWTRSIAPIVGDVEAIFFFHLMIWWRYTTEQITGNSVFSSNKRMSDIKWLSFLLDKNFVSYCTSSGFRFYRILLTIAFYFIFVIDFVDRENYYLWELYNFYDLCSKNRIQFPHQALLL